MLLASPDVILADVNLRDREDTMQESVAPVFVAGPYSSVWISASMDEDPLMPVRFAHWWLHWRRDVMGEPKELAPFRRQ
jgi:hypothetical protein